MSRRSRIGAASTAALTIIAILACSSPLPVSPAEFLDLSNLLTSHETPNEHLRTQVEKELAGREREFQRFASATQWKGWSVNLPELAKTRQRGKRLVVTTKDRDAALVWKGEIASDQVQVIELLGQVSEGPWMRLYWTNVEGVECVSPSFVRRVHGKDLRRYRFDVGDREDWKGIIRSISLHPGEVPTNLIIEEIRFLSAPTESERALELVESGLLSRATVGDTEGEIIAASRVDGKVVRVTLPPEPRLDLGWAILPARWKIDGPAARFLVESRSNGNGWVTVLESQLDPSRNLEDRSWLDGDVALEGQPGGSVELRFRVEAVSGEAVVPRGAVWSRPVLYSARSQEEQHPPVVLIVVDTLRADRMGQYGFPYASSPWLDRLARDGSLFGNAYAPSSWTVPSMVSVMTGEYPWSVAPPSGSLGIGEGTTTLAQSLRNRGYITAGFSANPLVDARRGFTRGFSRYFQRTSPMADSAHGEELTDRALEWLDRHSSAPFFLYVHYLDPHDPYDPPPPLYRFLSSRSSTMPESTPDLFKIRTRIFETGIVPGPRDLEELDQLYRGEIREVDRSVGRLLNGLRRMELYEKSLVVFIADHGEEFGEHRQVVHGHSLYDELVRVPFIMKRPGVLGAGIVETAPAEIRRMGAMVIAELEGESGTDYLQRESGESETVFSEIRPRGPWSRWIRPLKAVQRGEWKLILQPESGQKSLFRISADPGETQDLKELYPQETRSLLDLLDQESKSLDPGGLPEEELDAETLDRLRALGYVF